MAIMFSCSCGKQLRINDEHAGRRVKCPQCQQVLVAPGGADAEGAVTASAPRAPHPAPKQWDEGAPGTGQERSRGGKAPRKRRMPAWALIATVTGLVLIAGAVTAWLFWPRGEHYPELDFVPGDSAMVVVNRFADFWDSESGKKIQKALADQGINPNDETEKKLGVRLSDIERVTWVVPSYENKIFWGFVVSKKPFDKDKVVKTSFPQHQKPQTSEGKEYYADSDKAVHFVNERTLMVSNAEGVRDFLKKTAQPRTSGPMTEKVKFITGSKHHLSAVVVLPTEKLQGLKPFLKGEQQSKFGPLLDAQSITLAVNLGTEAQVDLAVQFPDSGSASSAKQAVQTLLDQIPAALPLLKLMAGDAAKDAPFDKLAEIIKKVKLEQSGSEVKASLKFDLELDKYLPLLAPAIQKTRQAATKVQSLNNLRQLGVSMHNYADSNGGSLPAAEVGGGLSWRVAILPYLGQKEKALYQQFHLNEPWDSEHNKKLIPQMPKVFHHPSGQTNQQAGMTYYQVITGGGPFNGKIAPRMPGSFPDGTSNTILIAETSQPVIWTRPVDLSYFPNGPLPRLGGLFPDGFNVVMADAQGRFVRKTVSEKTLRAAITPAGMDVLGADW